MSLHGKIIFRTDGNINIGIGRIIRCAALAEMLRENFECVLAIRLPDPAVLQFTSNAFHQIISLSSSDELDADELIPHLAEGDIVVLDGYRFQFAYQQKLISKNVVVSIDDLHHGEFCSSVIINPSEGVLPSDYRGTGETRFYLGSRYALLRKEFIQCAIENRILPSERKAIISMGAGDVHQLTKKVLSSLVKSEMVDEIEIIVSNFYPDINSLQEFIRAEKRVKILLCKNLGTQEICEVMKSARTMICPSNNTLLEAASIGMQIITGTTHDFQKGILHRMSVNGIAANCGIFLDASEEELISKFQFLLSDSAKAEEQVAIQKQVIDGKSPGRIREIFSLL